MNNLNRFIVRALAVVLAATVATSCATYTGLREAQQAEYDGDWDSAVMHYLELTKREPDNVGYRTALMRAKIKSSQMHLESGMRFLEANVLDSALIELQTAVQLDRSNQLAQVELDKVRQAIAAREAGERAESLAEMKQRAASERAQPPVLKPADDQPIFLSFPEAQDVKMIYRALAASAGINVLFAPDLRDARIPIELKGVTFQQGLELVMRAAGHFYKVYSEDTIFIADDTQQNRRLYEDQMIQSFFLSNAEPEAALNMLRGLVGARNVVEHSELNAIVMKDSADRVRVAEKIIDTFDKSRGEVMVDVELLEVNTSDLQDLGVSLSSYQVTQSLDFEGGAVPLDQIEFLNQSDWILTLPSIIYNFVKQSTNAEILAKPQLRISDGEEAELLIGEQVPVPVTSFNTSGTVGGNVVPITSFQYRDIGIQIRIEPRIHHNNEISLNAEVEVSSIIGFAPAAQGTSQPLIGTRRISSTIRLKNGETNFLAGLLRTDDNVAEDGIPGLSEIPVLGRLFTKTRDSKERLDLVLTITPHIVRMPDITEEDLQPIWVGTEESFSFRGGSPRIESEERGPFDEDQANQLQERLRRQLQDLPRDLRDQPDAGAQEPAQQQPEPTTLGVEPSGPSTLGDDDDGGNNNSSLMPGGGLPIFEWAEAAERLLLTQSDEEADEPRHAVEIRLVPVALEAGDDPNLLKVAIEVDSLSEVAHLPMTIDYDPRFLQFETMVAGDFLGRDDETTTMARAGRPGRLSVGLSRLGEGGGVSGEGIAALLNFRQVADGETELVIRHVGAMNGDLSGVADVAWQGLEVAVTGDGLTLPPIEFEPQVDEDDLSERKARRTRRSGGD